MKKIVKKSKTAKKAIKANVKITKKALKANVKLKKGDPDDDGRNPNY